MNTKAPSAPRISESVWQRCMVYLHDLWQRARRVIAVLAIVRFSLLIPAVLAATLIVADQMIDILRAVGEAKEGTAVIWLLGTAAFCALNVWYAARTMLRFRFASNPASDPDLHPRLKRILPRLVGIAIPAMLAFRVALLASSSAKPKGLWIFTCTLTLLTAVVAFYVIQRRHIAQRTGLHFLASPEPQETRNLHRFRELPPTTRHVFIVLIALAVAVNALFMWETFYDIGIPVMLGAPAILLLGLGLTTVGGSALVYMANHYGVPIISLLLVWTAFCSLYNDNHVVRINASARSHGFLTRAVMPDPNDLKTSSPLRSLTVDGYFNDWFDDLAHDEPGNDPIPVFVVAAEGGGLRAAYWTAAVLATLEDGTAASQTPFSRHVFAISGVSGGSVGAALFDAAVAERTAGEAQRTDTRLEEMDLMLRDDFLADTLGAALFPDLLQRFIPMPILNDRAIALDRAFDRAWGSVHPSAPDRLRHSFHDLWLANPHRVPLLFFNSTVVETGQRAINSPLATAPSTMDLTFADTLTVGRWIGTELPLSTAALLSARFTYVSPAALIDTHRTGAPAWIRLVDGGYFDNSGAVTAQEIVRTIIAAHDSTATAKSNQLAPPPRRPMRLVVLHLPNQPDIPSATLNHNKREAGSSEFMSEALAPIQTLLQTRGARGTQAVSFLREPAIPVLSIRPCTLNVAAPLGWVLSEQVRGDMRAQLKECGALGDNCAAPRLDWVKTILSGAPNTPYLSKFDKSPACVAPPAHGSAER
jgi:predicted acylesterase/phospholipase RssA